MKTYFFILSLFFATDSSATIWHIGKDKLYKKISPVLKLVSTGDTIMVYPGIYKEHTLVIDKSITFIGIDYPVLDGEKLYEVVSVKSNNVLIEGFRIQHSGISSMEDFAGIKVYNTHHVVIRNNILDDTFFGIYIQQGRNCLIEKNKLVSYAIEEQQSGNGIHCWKSDSLQIIANQISGHRDGIYFEFVTHSIIWRNVSQKNMRYGLHFMFSNNDTYISNVFKNNGAGVAVMFSNHVTMIRNFFIENWGDASYGLLLKEISDSHIENNFFKGNTSAIFMEGATRIEMQRNLFEGNGWGLKIQASCMDIILSENNFINNTFDVGTNGSLVLNSFYNNYWDRYEGYDINKDNIGDIPYRPVSMYSMIIEKNPPAMILFRSFITTLLDKAEKVLPSLTPENLIDNLPLMKPFQL